MGFGGAFVPLADDATAAFANPAGLVQLLRPELSMELRVRGTFEDETEDQPVLDSVSGVSFFSGVYPIGRWSFALYGHQLANLEFQSDGRGGSSSAAYGNGSGERIRKLSVGRLGFAGAFRFSENLSVGLGISQFDGTLRLTPFGDNGDPERSVTSRDWGLNAGILWRPTELVRFGGFYREGPSLQVGEVSTAIPTGLSPVAAETLDLPSSHGLGAAFRTRDRALTLAVQWDRIRYSSLQPGLATIAGGDPGLVVRDGDEFHVGAEYAFLQVNPVLAARLGVWLEPDHRACSTTSGSPYLCNGRSLGEVHVTGGFGLAFRKYQLDIGIDASRSAFAFSLSAIFSF